MRSITINRKKSLIACAVRVFIYVEANASELEKLLQIQGKYFKPVGTISNGKSLTFEIPYESIDVMAAYSAHLPLKYNTIYTVTSGEQNIELLTKPIYSPFDGNPFIIENIQKNVAEF